MANKALNGAEDSKQLPKFRAYDHIREQILSGIWPGGTRVRPENVAQELGISRMPVRDAIAQLDGEGLVTVRPHQGAIVTLLPPEDLGQLYEIRAVLEGLAARKAAEVIQPAHVDELRLFSERLLRSEYDAHQWLAAHDMFHDFICEIAQQKFLLQEIRRIRAILQPYLIMFVRNHPHREIEGDEHKALIDILASGNPTLAEHSFAHHIISASRGVIAQFAGRSTALPSPGRKTG